MSHFSWARVLELILPGETDGLLLKMCVLEGEACARATREWLAAVGSPTEYFRLERQGHKRLLPRPGRRPACPACGAGANSPMRTPAATGEDPNRCCAGPSAAASETGHYVNSPAHTAYALIGT